ncbi:hypothetical protein NLX83_23940 [Allokutzneria sp. A3M-2-11 16]|uniref:hypothetical protein n=1 Tax=Allokutzneria sp. A3M-2-11 16 TaxID=2962043 RepID=UPI0020B7E94E|nr:hypothetical protein [Allokutzneria sp. A3M-2-11 16]MCP3802327.1 hypothetical protein [Allokutzneria sp. A3M-2-11 16]
MDALCEAIDLLLPGERVLWTGRPVRFPGFVILDVLIAPLGVATLVYSGFVLRDLYLDGAAPMHFAALLAAQIACVFLVVGRPIVRHLDLRGTTYVVTAHRVIVASTPNLTRSVRTAYHSDLDAPQLSRRFDGSGTINFGDTFGHGELRHWELIHEPFRLKAVPDAAKVRDLLVAARREAEPVRARGSAGEEVLWTGKPLRHGVLGTPELILIPFGALLCGFGVQRLVDDAPGVYFLAAVAMAVAGAWVAVGVRATVARWLVPKNWREWRPVAIEHVADAERVRDLVFRARHASS